MSWGSREGLRYYIVSQVVGVGRGRVGESRFKTCLRKPWYMERRNWNPVPNVTLSLSMK